MLDLSDAGFLSDPTSHFWSGTHPEPKTLDQLADYRELVLLGEPGLGKSTALADEAMDFFANLSMPRPKDLSGVRDGLRR